MAGITDLPARAVALQHGATMVVSEMVASADMVNAKPSVRARAELGLDVARTVVQLAGREPYWMAEAARRCAGQGARVIDINFGCPSKMVTNGLSGSALMRDPDHALRLVEAVVAAVDVPVTVKMRLGWDEDCLTAPDIARRAEAAGVAVITVHGRTRCQFYKGAADWRAIAGVKAVVGIPVIANGDIVDAETAAEALRLSGADGVMIGRGARGQPWLLGRIAALLNGQTPPAEPSGSALLETIASHYEEILAFYGNEHGVRVARKHLGWYLDGIAGTAALRREVLVEPSPVRVLRLLRCGLADLPVTVAA